MEEDVRRSPHGERGLKCLRDNGVELVAQCRSPHGERGLKYLIDVERGGESCRSPHGERGLK